MRRKHAENFSSRNSEHDLQFKGRRSEKKDENIPVKTEDGKKKPLRSVPIWTLRDRFNTEGRPVANIQRNAIWESSSRWKRSIRHCGG